MSDRDQSYLEDMLSYTLDAIELLGAASVDELATDKMRRYAVTRATEIVGEAATNVSVEGRAALSAIPWRSVIGMRNVLIHGYVGLDLTILVDTVRNHFPPLVEMLREALKDSQP